MLPHHRTSVPGYRVLLSIILCVGRCSKLGALPGAVVYLLNKDLDALRPKAHDHVSPPVSSPTPGVFYT
jgi:hypothetical protein